MTNKMNDHKIYCKLKKENPEMSEIELINQTYYLEEKIKKAAAWFAIAISLGIFFLISAVRG